MSNTSYKKQNAITALNDFARSMQPLSVVFILEAIDRYSKEILIDKEAFRKAMANSIISSDLWIEIAENWENHEAIRKGKEKPHK